MQIDFNDNYIFAVILFMVGIWFAKNFLELLQTVCRVLENSNWCCGQDCIGYSAHEICNRVVRQSLAIFCFMQPLILCMIQMINGSRSGNFSSTIFFCAVHLNSTALVYKEKGVDVRKSTYELDIEHTMCSEVDYVVSMIPFAAMVSITTLYWVKLTSTGELCSDTLWDESVYSSGNNDSVFFYDLLYFGEVWCMNFAFVVGSSSEQSFWQMYYVVQAMTVGVIFFIVASRFTHETVTEQWIAVVFLVYLFGVMIPFWNAVVQVQCVVSTAIAMTHGFCVFVLVAGHYMASGRSPASYILSLRILVTVMASVTNMVVLMVGRNQYC